MFYHSLSLSVTHCHFLFLVVVHFHSPSFVVTCCTTHCHSLYHLLSFAVICCITRCHSLSPIISRCHSLSLDVPLVCLFINDGSDTSTIDPKCCFRIKEITSCHYLHHMLSFLDWQMAFIYYWQITSVNFLFTGQERNTYSI